MIDNGKTDILDETASSELANDDTRPSKEESEATQSAQAQPENTEKESAPSVYETVVSKIVEGDIESSSQIPASTTPEEAESTPSSTESEQEIPTSDGALATSLISQDMEEDGILKFGTVRFRGNLLLRHEESDTTFRIENANLTEATVGRSDQHTGFVPTVDLSVLEADGRSVSRRHATINQRGELILITDHNSLNGTFINGQKLAPEQARVLRDSDELRFGNLTLVVTFENVTA